VKKGGVVCPGQCVTQKGDMLTRNQLCDLQQSKIDRVRSALRKGVHDPSLMADIARLNTIIHIVVEFENKLFLDNMDIFNLKNKTE